MMSIAQVEPALRGTGDAAAPVTALAIVDELLRNPKQLLSRIERGEQLLALARALVVTIVVGTAVAGAALGLFRGGLQILFSGVKLPLVVLVTAGVCAPALTAIMAALGRPADFLRDTALVLASLALGSLMLAAGSPLLVLAVFFHASYHQLVLLTVAVCTAGGAVGLVLFWRGMAARGGRVGLATAAIFLALVSLVGSQMTWTMRPYLVRPRTRSVPFVRAIEGSFIDSVLMSLDSARGRYSPTPRPGVEHAPY